MSEELKLHNTKVKKISKQLQKFYKIKKKVRIYHGTTNSTRTQKFKKNTIIFTTDLDTILEINLQKGHVITEPNVPMDRLVKETLKFGFVPPVVMEFPGITVGGGVQGGAGESSSFKWGLFHEICLEYEIVLGNGTILKVSPKKNADLFWGTACSYGTLGVITKIKLKIIPAKQFVLLTYHRVTSFSQSVQQLKIAVKKPVDFIDGIMFSKNSGTIMTGVFSDKKLLPIVTFNKAIDDWFYTHAETVTNNKDTWQELIPLEEYLFRYNRGAFWVGKYAFQKLHLPFHRITRFLLNPLMNTRTLYRFLQAINISQRQIIQDFIVPEKATVSFMQLVDKTTHVYPLWLLPGYATEKKDKFSPSFLKEPLFIDVGVWGKVRGDYEALIKLNRTLEKLLQKVKGRKIFYAHQYYTQKEFWQIYDKSWYEKLRNKYAASNVFFDIYEKTHVSERYDYSILKGLLSVLKSPFKLPIS